MGVCAVNDCDGPCLPNSEYCFLHRKLNKEVEEVKKRYLEEDAGALINALRSVHNALQNVQINTAVKKAGLVLVILFLLAAITLGPGILCIFSSGICF